MKNLSLTTHQHHSVTLLYDRFIYIAIINAIFPNGYDTTRMHRARFFHYSHEYACSFLWPITYEARRSNINTENRGDSQTLLGFVTPVAEFTRLPRGYLYSFVFADTLTSLYLCEFYMYMCLCVYI